jgi:hypothetical protein
MSTRFIESLETRRLCAAHKSFKFGSLTGYTLPGTSLSYDTNFSLKSNLIDPETGSGQVSINVSKAGGGSQPKYLIQTSTDDFNTDTTSTSTLTLQSSGQNLNVIKLHTNVGNAAININLSNTRLTPLTTTLGTSYSDSGSFSGTFGGNTLGAKVSASVAGSATGTTKLLDTENVSVPAGTFSSIKGTYTISMTGSMHISLNGKSYNVAFSLSYANTFWAVQNVGIVKLKAITNLGLHIANESGKVTLTNNASLDDFSNFAPIHSASPFSSALPTDLQKLLASN